VRRQPEPLRLPPQLFDVFRFAVAGDREPAGQTFGRDPRRRLEEERVSLHGA
jgi:hypothetical protein